MIIFKIIVLFFSFKDFSYKIWYNLKKKLRGISMKKQITIITNAKEIRSAMKEQVDLIFEGLAQSEIYSIEDGSINNLTKADLYLLSSSAYEF